jgi:FtsH-binding integral membrane protein
MDPAFIRGAGGSVGLQFGGSSTEGDEMCLYLDFTNLFLFLLRFTGNRRE